MEERESVALVPRFAPRPRPTPIPASGVFDSPRVCVTINSLWVSHILGALEVLDQPDTWVGTETEITLARQQVREIMLALRLGNCGNGEEMDVRQNMETPCILEKSLDGLVWTQFANLSLCEAPAPAKTTRYNETTGELERSTDGGATWQPDRQNDPRYTGPRTETISDRCAAANSIVGYLQGYVEDILNNIEIGAALTAIVAGAIGIAAVVLSWGAAAPLVTGLVAAIAGFSAPAVRAALTSQVWEDVRCLIYCEIENGDITNVQYQGIWQGLTGIITGSAHTVIQHAIWSLGPVGLQNAAALGLSAAGIPASCDDCECEPEWCYEFDFTTGTQGFVRWPNQQWWCATYVAGVGWQSCQPNSGMKNLTIVREFETPLTGVKRLEADFSITGSANWVSIIGNGTPSMTSGQQSGAGGNRTIVAESQPATITSIQFEINNVSSVGTGTALRIRVYGQGTNPFGQDNC